MALTSLTDTTLRELAVLGARARLTELAEERNQLLTAFPDLVVSAVAAPAERIVPTTHPKSTVGRSRFGRKTPMTSAERKAVGDRMRKYWASRRKATRK